MVFHVLVAPHGSTDFSDGGLNFVKALPASFQASDTVDIEIHCVLDT